MNLWGSGLGRLIVGREVICEEMIVRGVGADERMRRPLRFEVNCNCRE